MDTVKIIIATHKKYEMPSDDIYIPLLTGADIRTDENGNKLDLGYQKDNTGENISAMKEQFSELKGLYWAWKNVDAEYIGLVHYRRHFMRKRKNKKMENVLTSKELLPLLDKYKVILPRKRNYVIESLYSHYKHTHYVEHLDETRNIIKEKYPDFVESFDKVINKTSGYMFNMMIMRKDLIDNYCKWLFDVLFELRERNKDKEMNEFDGRFYGRVSEIIFNVWLSYNISIGTINKREIKELPCVHMESINWWKKGTAFLRAKFFRKKYSGSF